LKTKRHVDARHEPNLEIGSSLAAQLLFCGL
jgi:hypothetical protein